MTDVTAIEARLVRLFDTPEFLVVAVLVALGVGALHAVAPGHGKSITAAYLVSGRARPRDAAVLGGVVAGMHTVSVAVLAVLWVAASAASTLATEIVTAWLQVAAAVMVVLVGLVLVRERVRGGSHHHHAHHLDHDHGQGHVHRQGHDLEHDHGHQGRSGRTHLDADHTISRRRLVALAMSGGLLPSPSAFLVLVSGLLTGRVGYAALLVSAFAAGMAGTLTVVGLVTIRGRDLLAANSVRHGALAAVHRRLPVVGACGVLAGGLVYLGAAVRAMPT